MKYILVSQGIKIYETYDKEEALKMLCKMNGQWYNYKQNCLDNHIQYADNKVFMYEEEDNDKFRIFN